MNKKLNILKEHNFDLFVIGGGSGGVRAARYASSRGLKVGLAEGWDLGGTCVNRGCVPKKLYSFSSHFSDEIELMQSFGWSVKKFNFSWNKLVENKKKELKRLNGIYRSLLSNSGVTVFKGFASFLNKQSLKVSGNIIFSKKIILSVGSKPRKLIFSDPDYTITSDEAFDIKKLPKSILILGGGYIAVEFASIFNGLGVDTTICIRGNKILRGFDEDVSIFLMNQMEIKGIKFIKENFPKKIIKNKDFFDVIFKNNKKKYNLVMQAIGRDPNLELLKIDNVGINLNKNGSIAVDDYFETSIKNIYAIGDIIDRVQLTPVAIAEAMNLVENILEKRRKKFQYNNIPTAVFTNPNFACIGYTEKEAKKKFKKIDIFESKFKPLKFSLSQFKEKVFIKLVVNSKDNKILGIHFVGENAAEIIQGFSVAVVNGLTKDQLDKTIGIHPTSAEELVTMKKIS